MAETVRGPYDGLPYYCTTCGLGLGEFLACEEAECELESAQAAQLRAQRKRSVKGSASAVARAAKEKEA